MTTIRHLQQGGFNADPIQTYRDLSFVAGDSPVTHDVQTDLNGRHAAGGYVKNDGIGEFTVAIASSGTNYGDEIPVLKGEALDLKNEVIAKIRITWVSNSSYRIALV